MSKSTTVILGGGFGGLSAANTLRSLLPEDHEIVVIDQSSRFHVGAGKTWLMLGERTSEQVSQSRLLLLAPGVRFLEAAVNSIDIANRSVIAGAETLPWDFLVVALGADVNLSAIPGLESAAHTFYTVAGAERLRTELGRFTGGEVAVLIPRLPFKCPPAPYEATLLLHAAFQRRGLGSKVRLAIHTAEGIPMATAGPEMGEAIKAELANRSIGFYPQRATVRIDGTRKRIVFQDDVEAPYDLLIAVPPHEAPRVAREAQLTNASGWIPVDPSTLKVTLPTVTTPVYAIGDITTVPLPGRYKPGVSLSLPKAGVFAEAHGRVVAHQIAATVLGRTTNEAFDGKGFCYLEVGDRLAMKANGSFFEMPHPIMRRATPDEAQFRDKVAWVERLLEPKRPQ